MSHLLHEAKHRMEEKVHDMKHGGTHGLMGPTDVHHGIGGPGFHAPGTTMHASHDLHDIHGGVRGIHNMKEKSKFKNKLVGHDHSHHY